MPDYRMDVETGHYRLTGHGTKLVHTVVKKTVQKNWPMILGYGAVTGGGIVASYWTNQWISVGLSVLVALITFFIGLRMIRDIITITSEVH